MITSCESILSWMCPPPQMWSHGKFGTSCQLCRCIQMDIHSWISLLSSPYPTCWQRGNFCQFCSKAVLSKGSRSEIHLNLNCETALLQNLISLELRTKLSSLEIWKASQCGWAPVVQALKTRSTSPWVLCKAPAVLKASIARAPWIPQLECFTLAAIKGCWK